MGLTSLSHVAAWANSSLAVEVPKGRRGSCQSFQSQGSELAVFLPPCSIGGHSVTSPGSILREAWQSKRKPVSGGTVDEGQGKKVSWNVTVGERFCKALGTTGRSLDFTLS